MGWGGVSLAAACSSALKQGVGGRVDDRMEGSSGAAAGNRSYRDDATFAILGG
jgi:hypothetical protein